MITFKTEERKNNNKQLQQQLQLQLQLQHKKTWNLYVAAESETARNSPHKIHSSQGNILNGAFTREGKRVIRKRAI